MTRTVKVKYTRKGNDFLKVDDNGILWIEHYDSWNSLYNWKKRVSYKEAQEFIQG